MGTGGFSPSHIFYLAIMEMAQYILSILMTQIGVVWSWGFHKAMAIEDGLQFNAQGFLFTGKVRVLYDGGTDTFIVMLINRDGSIHEEHTDVYLENLVDVIDRAVEKNCSQSEYVEKVNAAYGYK